MSENKVNLFEVEINKINLKPGDILLVKVRGPDFENYEVCEALKHSLKSVFTNNKVGVLFMENNEMDFSVITQETAEMLEKASDNKESSCNTGNYCVDCNCGKKTKAEKLKHTPLIEEDLELLKGLPEDDNAVKKD